LNGRLTTEKNRLKRKEEVGLNLGGNYFPPDTQLCKSIFSSCQILHNTINKNLKERRFDVQQGPILEKVLVFGNLFTYNESGKIGFNIIDISPNDSLELSWKRQINKLYLKNYSKCV
jgi:hypothetical protein